MKTQLNLPGKCRSSSAQNVMFNIPFQTNFLTMKMKTKFSKKSLLRIELSRAFSTSLVLLIIMTLGRQVLAQELVLDENLFINNGQNSAIYFPNHNLTIGTKSGTYYHNSLNLKPGGSDSGVLYSTLRLFTANSPDSHTEKIRITTNGNSFFNAGKVGIGTDNPSDKLTVNGTVKCKKARVTLEGFADFVFEKNYDLPTLEEVERHINENGHLKDIPKEAEVMENGLDLGEMNVKLLQKVEELTLYVIELNKQAKTQQAMMEKQQTTIAKQQEIIEELQR